MLATFVDSIDGRENLRPRPRPRANTLTLRFPIHIRLVFSQSRVCMYLHSRAAALLSTRPVVTLAAYTYGIYIMHVPALFWFSHVRVFGISSKRVLPRSSAGGSSGQAASARMAR